MTLLDTIEIEPSQPATASIIWLHGLGADGHDFEAIVPELQLPANTAIRFIFPHAPVRPVTMNGGMEMRAWYDIAGIGHEYHDDEAGIRESEQLIQELVKREVERGIQTDRVILAGFSQGGAIVLHTGLRYPESLAGILALSCYLPLADKLEKEAAPANSGTPIMMLHGVVDQVVPIGLAESGYNQLKKLAYSVHWEPYTMEHSVCAEELHDIRNWIIKILS